MLDKKMISMLKLLILISAYVRECPCFHEISTGIFKNKLNFKWFSTNNHNINSVCMWAHTCMCVYKECVLAQMWQNVNWRI